MPGDNTRNYLHLHLIVFIWGFTAVLGKLISLDAIPLVWHRMLWATIIILAYLLIRKINLRISGRGLALLLAAGIAIAVHWVTFFQAIKVSNVSTTLAIMATGSFFAALIEPLWYKRKFIGYEMLFSLLVILGLVIVFGVNREYTEGIILALISAFLGAIFTLINGKLISRYRPSVITFYELGIGVLGLTFYLAIDGEFEAGFFRISASDLFYLGILASVCTAYAFIGSVKVMRYLSPYTVLLTVNMEPIYGMLLALWIFGQDEQMSFTFYLGALLIIATVVLNGILKYRAKKVSS